MPTTVVGSDLAGVPQGAMLQLIVAELRVISVLLQAIASGQVISDSPETLRADVIGEPKVTATLSS